MARHKVKLSTCEIEIDESTSLADIERAEPHFFSGNRRRETFTMHRGAVICRHTVQFSRGKPERHTAVYLVDRSPDSEVGTFCVSADRNLASIAQAKRHVDRIIESGEYHYGR